jgi:hypothetical protein
MREGDAERVDPEQVRVAGVAHGDVACHPDIETQAGEDAERGRQAVLARASLRCDIATGWLIAEDHGRGCRCRWHDASSVLVWQGSCRRASHLLVTSFFAAGSAA